MVSFSRTFSALASVVAASDPEALHLLQTQARPRHASETAATVYREEGDPEFNLEDAGPRGDAPPGSVRADYDAQGQTPGEVVNLRFHQLKYRNLNGMGPHTSMPPNVRYEKVARGVDGKWVDMILESNNFVTAKPHKVGLFGSSAVVNIKNGNEVDFTARFVENGSDNDFILGPFHISFMDLDTGKTGGQEELTIGGFVSRYYLDTADFTEVAMGDGRTRFIAGEPGVGADNPFDPMMLTDVQAKRTVSFQFPGGLSSFSFSYKVAAVSYEDYDAESEGRHFFLSGMTSLYFCEINPVVIDYNLATVRYSNLGGLGPDYNSPKGLRFDNVAAIENDQMLDMIVSNLTEYEAANTTNNGLNGEFAQVNILGGTSTKFRFQFLKHGTDDPFTMDWNYISIFDLDHGKRKEQYKETMEIKGFATHYLTETSELHLTQHGEKWYTYASTTFGTGKDNPTDPMNLTQVQKDRSVTLLFHNKNFFDARFGSAKPKKAGRNFLFSGKSALVFC